MLDKAAHSVRPIAVDERAVLVRKVRCLDIWQLCIELGVHEGLWGVKVLFVESPENGGLKDLVFRRLPRLRPIQCSVAQFSFSLLLGDCLLQALQVLGKQFSQ